MGGENDREMGLTELLASLGEELREANERAGENHVATLAWAEATIEVVLEARTTEKGGIKFAVLGIGAEAGAGRGMGRTVRAQVRCVPARPPVQTTTTFMPSVFLQKPADAVAGSNVPSAQVTASDEIVGVDIPDL
jgi:hypothetical protein